MEELQNLESLYPKETREKEISQLFSFIKEGKSLELVGLPGAGRGNLLGLLAYNRSVRIHHVGEEHQSMYHFVLTNFSEMRNRPLFDVMKFLFLELTSSLHERKKEEEFNYVDKLFKHALAYKDELVLFQALKDAVDFLCLEKNLTVVYLLDRFESYIPELTSAFFTNLRSLRNRAKYKFCVVFSTTRPLEDMLEPELIADFYEFIVDNTILLSLSDPIGLVFRKTHLEKITNKTISEICWQSLLSHTGGHGKLMRVAEEAVLAQGMEEKEIEKEFLLSQKTIQGALLELWYFLTPDEQQDITKMCLGQSCPLPDPFLKKIGLLENEKITIPLFTAFLQERKKDLTQNEPFVYDASTQTIKKGSLIVSDMLTGAEFHLLRVLLEHKGDVVDRNHIAEMVWSGNKSQAGVSEQAIDQLVLRLRKKIENDPNNPTHILTVKGRGIRFAQ